MYTCAKYIALAKTALGDERMSDRELGQYLGKTPQQTVSHAKGGKMSVKFAHRLGVLLYEHEKIDHPGEVMLVAQAERTTGKVRATLMEYAKKVLASVLFALAAVLGPTHVFDAQAAGGSGGIRTHGRVSPSPVFKTGAFNRSATLPGREFYRRPP